MKFPYMKLIKFNLMIVVRVIYNQVEACPKGEILSVSLFTIMKPYHSKYPNTTSISVVSK